MTNNIQDDILNQVFSFKISKDMDAITDKSDLIASFVKKTAEIFKAGKVSFMLLDESHQELSVEASYGLNPAASHAKVKLGEPFGGLVAKDGRALLVKNVESEYPEVSRNRLARYSTKSFLIVPVKIKDDVIGVLSLTDKKDRGVFTDDDLKILDLIAQNFALYIENLRLSEKVNNLSNLDQLTGLSNHRHFHEQMLEEIYRAERYKRPFALIILDIDGFSEYNQAHGYSSGDNVLKQISRIIKDNIRQADVVGRYGADEFGIILSETKLKRAIYAGERIKEKVNYAIFTEDEERKSSLGMSKLTVSLGVVEHRIGLSKDELINRATSALQEAHKKGKNSLCVFK